MSTGYTLTTNDALAYASSGNVLIDYFTAMTRTLAKDKNNEYLAKCWQKDARKTVAIIFNTRDRLKGKKEKTISNDAMLWLHINKPETYKKNIMTYVSKYGCWKDVLYIARNLKGRQNDFEVQFFADQLLRDKLALDNDCNASVSLCAKWAPSENDSSDKTHHLAKKIASKIYSRDDLHKMQKFRKEYLTPLRKRINVLETLMCDNEWDSIRYESVSGVASKRYIKAFTKHDKERYENFLADVRNGKKSIKTAGILPHELVKYYINNPNEANETIELQWQAILKDVMDAGVLSKMMPIVDVSGSMYAASNGDVPAQVSITMGILCSLCCQGQFHRKLIAFSEKPTLTTLKGNSLYECYKEIIRISQGLNTNFVACAELITQFATTFNVPQENMPDKFVVLTDMQFDAASNTKGDMQTVYQRIKDIFEESGYRVPKFIFWNLNSDASQALPVKSNDDGTALVSGFSEQLLKVIMQFDDFNSENIFEECIRPYLQDVVIDESEL